MKLFLCVGGLADTLSDTQRAIAALVAVFTLGISIGAYTALFYGLPAKVQANTEAIAGLIEAQRVLSHEVCELAQPEEATLAEIRQTCRLLRSGGAD